MHATKKRRRKKHFKSHTASEDWPARDDQSHRLEALIIVNYFSSYTVRCTSMSFEALKNSGAKPEYAIFHSCAHKHKTVPHRT